MAWAAPCRSEARGAPLFHRPEKDRITRLSPCFQNYTGKMAASDRLKIRSPYPTLFRIKGKVFAHSEVTGTGQNFPK
jgi:hypothetical protein